MPQQLSDLYIVVCQHHDGSGAAIAGGFKDPGKANSVAQLLMDSNASSGKVAGVPLMVDEIKLVPVP